MDCLLKSHRPLKVKEEPPEVIDLIETKTPEEFVYEWDHLVRRQLNQQIVSEDKDSVYEKMHWYLRQMRTDVSDFEDLETSSNVMVKHIKCLSSLYHRFNSILDEKYLDVMEEILVTYCNIVICYVTKKRKSVKNREIKKIVTKESRKMKCLLPQCLMEQSNRVLHVLMKVNVDPSSQSCRDILTHLYGHFITRVPQSTSDENFLRGYIIFQKWKLIRKPEEHTTMDKCMFTLYRKTPEMLHTNELFKQVLKSDPVNGGFSMGLNETSIGPVGTMLKNYFDYVKNKGRNEKDVIFDGVGLENLDIQENLQATEWDYKNVDEEFKNEYRIWENEVISSNFLHNTAGKELISVKEEPPEKNIDDCVLVGNQNNDGLLVTEILEDDDITHITYEIKGDKTLPSRVKEKVESKRKIPSFLDSIDLQIVPDVSLNQTPNRSDSNNSSLRNNNQSSIFNIHSRNASSSSQKVPEEITCINNDVVMSHSEESDNDTDFLGLGFLKPTRSREVCTSVSILNKEAVPETAQGVSKITTNTLDSMNAMPICDNHITKKSLVPSYGDSDESETEGNSTETHCDSVLNYKCLDGISGNPTTAKSLVTINKTDTLSSHLSKDIVMSSVVSSSLEVQPSTSISYSTTLWKNTPSYSNSKSVIDPPNNIVSSPVISCPPVFSSAGSNIFANFALSSQQSRDVSNTFKTSYACSNAITTPSIRTSASLLAQSLNSPNNLGTSFTPVGSLMYEERSKPVATPRSVCVMTGPVHKINETPSDDDLCTPTSLCNGITGSLNVPVLTSVALEPSSSLKTCSSSVSVPSNSSEPLLESPNTPPDVSVAASHSSSEPLLESPTIPTDVSVGASHSSSEPLLEYPTTPTDVSVAASHSSSEPLLESPTTLTDVSAAASHSSSEPLLKFPTTSDVSVEDSHNSSEPILESPTTSDISVAASYDSLKKLTSVAKAPTCLANTSVSLVVPKTSYSYLDTFRPTQATETKVTQYLTTIKASADDFLNIDNSKSNSNMDSYCKNNIAMSVGTLFEKMDIPAHHVVEIDSRRQRSGTDNQVCLEGSHSDDYTDAGVITEYYKETDCAAHETTVLRSSNEDKIAVNVIDLHSSRQSDVIVCNSFTASKVSNLPDAKLPPENPKWIEAIGILTPPSEKPTDEQTNLQIAQNSCVYTQIIRPLTSDKNDMTGEDTVLNTPESQNDVHSDMEFGCEDSESITTEEYREKLDHFSEMESNLTDFEEENFSISPEPCETNQQQFVSNYSEPFLPCITETSEVTNKSDVSQTAMSEILSEEAKKSVRLNDIKRNIDTSVVHDQIPSQSFEYDSIIDQNVLDNRDSSSSISEESSPNVSHCSTDVVSQKISVSFSECSVVDSVSNLPFKQRFFSASNLAVSSVSVRNKNSISEESNHKSSGHNEPNVEEVDDSLKTSQIDREETTLVNVKSLLKVVPAEEVPSAGVVGIVEDKAELVQNETQDSLCENFKGSDEQTDSVVSDCQEECEGLMEKDPEPREIEEVMDFELEGGLEVTEIEVSTSCNGEVDDGQIHIMPVSKEVKVESKKEGISIVNLSITESGKEHDAGSFGTLGTQEQELNLESPAESTCTSPSQFVSNHVTHWETQDNQDMEQIFIGPVTKLNGTIVNPDENFDLFECEKTTETDIIVNKTVKVNGLTLSSDAFDKKTVLSNVTIFNADSTLLNVNSDVKTICSPINTISHVKETSCGGDRVVIYPREVSQVSNSIENNVDPLDITTIPSAGNRVSSPEEILSPEYEPLDDFMLYYEEEVTSQLVDEVPDQSKRLSVKKTSDLTGCSSSSNSLKVLKGKNHSDVKNTTGALKITPPEVEKLFDEIKATGDLKDVQQNLRDFNADTPGNRVKHSFDDSFQDGIERDKKCPKSESGRENLVRRLRKKSDVVSVTKKDLERADCSSSTSMVQHNEFPENNNTKEVAEQCALQKPKKKRIMFNKEVETSDSPIKRRQNNLKKNNVLHSILRTPSTTTARSRNNQQSLDYYGISANDVKLLSHQYDSVTTDDARKRLRYTTMLKYEREKRRLQKPNHEFVVINYHKTNQPHAENVVQLSVSPVPTSVKKQHHIVETSVNNEVIYDKKGMLRNELTQNPSLKVSIPIKIETISPELLPLLFSEHSKPRFSEHPDRISDSTSTNSQPGIHLNDSLKPLDTKITVQGDQESMLHNSTSLDFANISCGTRKVGVHLEQIKNEVTSAFFETDEGLSQNQFVGFSSKGQSTFSNDIELSGNSLPLRNLPHFDSMHILKTPKSEPDSVVCINVPQLPHFNTLLSKPALTNKLEVFPPTFAFKNSTNITECSENTMVIYSEDEDSIEESFGQTVSAIVNDISNIILPNNSNFVESEADFIDIESFNTDPNCDSIIPTFYSCEKVPLKCCTDPDPFIKNAFVTTKLERQEEIQKQGALEEHTVLREDSIKSEEDTLLKSNNIHCIKFENTFSNLNLSHLARDSLVCSDKPVENYTTIKTYDSCKSLLENFEEFTEEPSDVPKVSISEDPEVQAGKETYLPLKKRKKSVAVGKNEDTKNETEELPSTEVSVTKNDIDKILQEVKEQLVSEQSKEMSYPATPMMSIADIQEHDKLPRPAVKTAAERKELPPIVDLQRTRIVTEQYNNHTYNNATINYHMSGTFPQPFINYAGMPILPAAYFPAMIPVISGTTTITSNVVLPSNTTHGSSEPQLSSTSSTCAAPQEYKPSILFQPQQHDTCVTQQHYGSQKAPDPNLVPDSLAPQNFMNHNSHVPKEQSCMSEQPSMFLPQKSSPLVANPHSQPAYFPGNPPLVNNQGYASQQEQQTYHQLQTVSDKQLLYARQQHFEDFHKQLLVPQTPHTVHDDRQHEQIIKQKSNVEDATVLFEKPMFYKTQANAIAEKQAFVTNTLSPLTLVEPQQMLHQTNYCNQQQLLSRKRAAAPAESIVLENQVCKKSRYSTRCTKQQKTSTNQIQNISEQQRILNQNNVVTDLKYQQFLYDQQKLDLYQGSQGMFHEQKEMVAKPVRRGRGRPKKQKKSH